MTYYNEFDAKPAAWLRELAAQGHISKGVVDEKSIKDLRGADVTGHDRAHFFAGIGGWDYALQLAGWPADRPVWTGSCPCQPFSSAGKGLGTDDPRHLWPDFARLISECRPPVVFGEQVASPTGRQWLAGVRADLERMGYAVGAVDLCAAGVGAPHIRQRLYWVGALRYAVPAGPQVPQPEDLRGARRREEGRTVEQSGHGSVEPLQHAENDGRVRGVMGHEAGSQRQALGGRQDEGRRRADLADASPWSRYDILHFRDGKARRIEPGLEPLAYGPPARVGRLRGYGNAIVPQVAAVFVRAFLESTHGI